MVKSCPFAEWSGILMPFELRTKFSLVFRPPSEYRYWTIKSLLFRFFRCSDVCNLDPHCNGVEYQKIWPSRNERYSCLLLWRIQAASPEARLRHKNQTWFFLTGRAWSYQHILGRHCRSGECDHGTQRNGNSSHPTEGPVCRLTTDNCSQRCSPSWSTWLWKNHAGQGNCQRSRG